MDRLRAVEREGLRTDLPAFDPGDTVRVMVRVREGDKERLQAFEGVCIARRGAGINATFTVRKISAGVGVERIFPSHSPSIAEIELVRKGRVRRAKLYFLRRLAGKAARIRRSEEHTSELQSPCNLVCRLLLEKTNTSTVVTALYAKY